MVFPPSHLLAQIQHESQRQRLLRNTHMTGGIVLEGILIVVSFKFDVLQFGYVPKEEGMVLHVQHAAENWN